MSESSAIWAARGAADRWRRAMRQRLLTPVVLNVRSIREALLNALAGRGHLVFCRLPHGNYFVDPSDRVIGSWLMWRGGWQWEEIDQAIAVLGGAGVPDGGKVFVDCGANIGTQTIYALRDNHFTRAVAFEPEPRNLELLTMNVAANGLERRVEVVGKALGTAPGRALLHLHPRNKGAHAIGLRPSLDGTETVGVDVVRLDTALAGLGVAPETIGLIWIDVEGAELDVLHGLGDLIGKVPLVVEYAPDRYATAEGDVFRRLLKAHYSTMHRLGEGGPEPLPISDIDRITSISDILFM